MISIQKRSFKYNCVFKNLIKYNFIFKVPQIYASNIDNDVTL